MKNICKLVLISVFVLFLLYPSIAVLTEKLTDKSSPKKELPTLENNNIFKYFGDFDNYYSKEFNGRNMYYSSISALKYKLFGTSAKRESVLTGKDGFLFLGNNAGHIVDETLGLNVFSDREIKQIQKRVLSTSRWMKKNDIRFYMMIAPNKHTIYPEKLPFKVDTNRLTKIDQIAEIIDDTKHVTPIELKESLIRAKNRGLVYHKTDTHWNTFGAYFAYWKIMNVLNEDFPGEFRPISLKNMKQTKREGRTLGLSRMLNYPIEETTKEVKIRKPRSIEQAPELNMKRRANTKAEIRYKAPKKKRKAVIIRDSFSAALVDFLKEHFEEVVFIWASKIDEDIILKEKPDIVIYEIVERNVDRMRNM